MEAKDELWLFFGQTPVQWRMPFRYRALSETHGELWYALTPYQWHKQVVDAMLEKIAKPFHGMWIIKRRDLEKTAAFIQGGGDPERLFSWSSKAAIVSDKPRPEESVEREKFIEALFQKQTIPNVSTWQELYYIYKEICLHMMDTLINKEQPVDLFFFKLHNCPLRQNWQMIQFARFPKTSTVATRANMEERQGKSGFNDNLTNVGMISFNPRLRICHRHITVEHTRAWWKMMLRCEQTRLRQLGHEKYAAYFRESVSRFLGTAKRCFREFMAQIKAPAVAGIKGKQPGAIRFIPFIPRLQSKLSRHVYIHRIVADPADRIPTNGAEVHVSPSYGSLSEMQHLQRLKENLRDRLRREMERSDTRWK